MDRGWTLEELSDASGVDVGTIGALEVRDSKRSEKFPAIAKALGLTLEQLADETYTPPPVKQIKYPPNEGQSPPLARQHTVRMIPDRRAAHDKWTAEALEIMLSLDVGQRQGMVAKMREFKHFLGPPRVGQVL